MTEQEMKARIERSRELIDWSREEYQSDQTLKKAPAASGEGAP